MRAPPALSSMRPFALLVGIVAAGCAVRQEPTEISLERTGCFGFCPRYKIALRADGSVTYAGPGYQDSETGHRLNPSLPERADTVVPDAVIRTAFAAFESGWSRWLPNRFQIDRRTCLMAATDHPTVYVVRNWKDRSDTTEVYYGCSAIPQRLTRLANYN